MRAPYQILLQPFRRTESGAYEFALFKRDPATGGYWQPVAGGGEDAESPLMAARREAMEEAGIELACPFYRLDTTSSVPKYIFNAPHWPADLYVVPEHSFAVDVGRSTLVLSSEHTELAWFGYEDAYAAMHWDSNRHALWELSERLKAGTMRPAH